MQTKTKDKLEKSILLVPLFIAFVWMAFTVVDSKSTDPGMKLAPSALDGMVTALFIFIIGYAVVLTVMFIKMNRTLRDIGAIGATAGPEIKKEVKTRVRKK